MVWRRDVDALGGASEDEWFWCCVRGMPGSHVPINVLQLRRVSVPNDDRWINTRGEALPSSAFVVAWQPVVVPDPPIDLAE